MSVVTTAAPGIYHGMPAEEYHAIPAVSRTQLLRLFHSPAAFKYAEEREESLAMKGGSYVHMAVLEPDRFAESVVVMPNFHGGMNDETAVERISKTTGEPYAGGKQAKARWELEHAGQDVIDGAIRDEAMGIARAVHDCAAARTLLHGNPKDSEVTVVAELDGVLCKGRMDRFFENNNGGWTIVDLKRTKSVRPATFFADTVKRFRLHIQDAFYTRLAQTVLGVEPDPVFGDGWAFAFVCFESMPPHHSAVFELGGSSREVGQREVARMLKVVRWCEERGEWPDYSTRVHRGELPTYYDEYELPETYREESPDE